MHDETTYPKVSCRNRQEGRGEVASSDHAGTTGQDAGGTTYKVSAKAKKHEGQTFGRLTVIEVTGVNARGQAVVLCKCECGNEWRGALHSLKSGITKSCGCFRREFTTAKNTTHGQSFSKEHRAWTHIKTRTTNPNCNEWHNYGGRGVRMCAEWSASFESFLAHVGPAPSADHSIDRFPNKDGNYEPGNVRWATDLEQNQNRRDNVLSPELVRDIRALKSEGTTNRAIARWLNIKLSTVESVTYGRAWPNH